MTETPDPLKVQIKQGIVRSLRLPIAWEDIGDATSLFDGGLGLDSIDVLELVLEVERTFGVAISDEKVGMQVLRSVDTIAEYIRAQGGKEPV